MLQIRPLPVSLAQIAVNDLNENEDRMREDVVNFREWILKQPHLNARTDDQFLVTYLRGCKHSLEKAKAKLDLFYTTRTALPDYFKNRNIHNPRTLELIRLGYAVPIPKSNGEGGPRVFLVRPAAFDPRKYHVQDIMKVMTLVADYQNLMDDNILIAGYKVIVDAGGLKPAHILQYDPMFLKKMSTYFQDSCVSRFKGAYMLNVPSGLEVFMNLIKSFLNEKNKSRLKILGNDFKQLYDHIPKSLLPSEYGGDVGTIESIMNGWIKIIEENEDLLRQEELYGTDERKRSGEGKNEEGLFGTAGTFRSLNLD